MRKRVEAEVQDSYLTKNPLTAVSVLLSLKLRDFIVITLDLLQEKVSQIPLCVTQIVRWYLARCHALKMTERNV